MTIKIASLSRAALIINSAFLYAIPFHIPALWPLLFLYTSALYIPISRTSFLVCFIHGLILFNIQLIAIFQALFTMAQGALLIKVAPIVYIALYAALFPALWLWFSFRYTHSLTTWTISTWLYFLTIHYLMLAPFGIIEGYPFANPLIIMPLFFQQLIFWIPLSFLLLYFCIISSCITAWLITPTRTHFFIIMLSIIPCVASWIYNPIRPPLPAWLAHIYPLPIKIPTQSPEAMISALSYYFNGDWQSIAIMPESAWPTDTTNLLSWPHKPAHLIAGGFHHLNSLHRTNRLSWIHDNQIESFDKTHALPLVERSILPWLDRCFFTSCKPITPATNSRPLWHLTPDCILAPYICSELFFNHTPPLIPPSTCILACCNDWWFTMPYFQKLMARAAQFQAIEWHRSIIFISYHSALYFDVFGNSTNLNRDHQTPH